MTMANDKEFDRSVCFTFYESYLTQAELIKEQYGANEAYDSLSGIIKYALYKEEPANIMAKIVLEGLKNTIDAGQAKRASGFAKKSNAEMDEKIIQYKKDNPDATYEQIKEALGCSKGKISKVLKNSVHVHDVHDHNTVNVNVNKNVQGGCDVVHVHDVHVHDESVNMNVNKDSSNSNSNSNTNINSNSNTNTNTVNVNVNKGSRPLVHDVHVHDHNTVNVNVNKGSRIPVQDVHDVHVHAIYREREREQESDAVSESSAEQNASRFDAVQSQKKQKQKGSQYKEWNLNKLDDDTLERIRLKLLGEVPYNTIYEEENLKKGCLNKDSVSEIEMILMGRMKDNDESKIVDSCSADEPSIEKLSVYSGYSVDEVRKMLSKYKMDCNILLSCFESDSKHLYTYDYWNDNYKKSYSDYWKWIHAMYEANKDNHASFGNSVMTSMMESSTDDYTLDDSVINEYGDDMDWIKDMRIA